MTNQEALEHIEQLKHFADLVESPEEYFIHMQGHIKELSLILTVFDVAESYREIKEALETVEKLQAELDQWKREAISSTANLGEYKILEGQGLLHRAQVKDGTPIFYYYVEDELFCEGSGIVESTYLYGHTEYGIGELGKDWFLTREEAEKRLVEWEGGAEE